MLRRSMFAILAFGLLAACGANSRLDPNPDPIGDFRLGFNVVVANDIQKGPASRDATEEELTDALRAAMEERLGRYDGDGLYHIGLRIEAYTLGQTGVPILFSRTALKDEDGEISDIICLAKDMTGYARV